MVEALEQLWNGLLDLTSTLVIPDWGALVALLPVFLVLGVLGPLLSIVLLVWVIYYARRPRTKVRFAEGPVAAPIGADGKPVFPTAEPYCFRDGLIYPPGIVRCAKCGDELSITCPKCNVARRVSIDACGNCGLALRLEPRPRALMSAGPPPGGAAAA
jgi:hypothetical protein